MKSFLNQILLGDCLDLIPKLPAASVDCVLTDLPYGTTENKWDSVIPMNALWEAWRGCLKPGAPVILFTQQPFTTAVAGSNLKQLRTEWIWEKPCGTGFLNAKRYPLKNHENILVFCDRKPPYFPQKEMGGGTYRTKKRAGTDNYRFHAAHESINTDGSRYPKTVLKFGNRGVHRGDRGLHPTQKPINLVEYLIRTYTAPGETILDNCAGSGTTLHAARNTGRAFIGIERDPGYHAVALRRLDCASKL